MFACHFWRWQKGSEVQGPPPPPATEGSSRPARALEGAGEKEGDGAQLELKEGETHSQDAQFHTPQTCFMWSYHRGMKQCLRN